MCTSVDFPAVRPDDGVGPQRILHCYVSRWPLATLWPSVMSSEASRLAPSRFPRTCSAGVALFFFAASMSRAILVRQRLCEIGLPRADPKGLFRGNASPFRTAWVIGDIVPR